MHRHILTIGLEDFFQVDAFSRLIGPQRWSRFERRLERSTARVLDLLDSTNTRATFFVLGWTAETTPELVRGIAERGHEIGSRGYDHCSVATLEPGAFRADLDRARGAIERAAAAPLFGYRAARLWYSPQSLWALDVLAQEGYKYDSSLAPFLRRFAGQPWRRYPHRVPTSAAPIWELPVSTTQLLGLSLPIAGGNYARQLPAGFLERRIRRWFRDERAPFLMYFHAWELDPEQPQIAAPLLQRIRQYRNLDRTHGFLERWLSRHPFGTAAEFLGLAQPSRTREAPLAPAPVVRSEPRPDQPRTAVSLVVPCCNTAASVARLSENFSTLSSALGNSFALHLVLVDDGSSDGTAAELDRAFGGVPNASLVTHPRQIGFAAAVRTGILHARTDMVCTMHPDWEPDAELVRALLGRLTPGVALVTASPYHRAGGVTGVPGWRLLPVRLLSRAYRALLGADVASYTTSIRAYRRSAVVACRADAADSAGTAEILGRLVLAGERVVELPAVLRGGSPPRPAGAATRAAWGHLCVVSRLAGRRVLLAASRATGRLAAPSPGRMTRYRETGKPATPRLG